MIVYERRARIGRKISLRGKTSVQFPMINLNEKVRQKEFGVSTSFIKEMLKTFLLNYYETKRQLLVITMYQLIRAYRQAK